jgi:small neutral amino acid transporter SnatA (MarC family)
MFILFFFAGETLLRLFNIDVASFALQLTRDFHPCA